MKIPLLNKDFSGEFQLRIDKIRHQMKKSALSAILVADNTNLLYVSGCVFRGYIYIPLDSKLNPVFFIIRPLELGDDDAIVTIRKPEEIANKLSERGYPIVKTLGLEFDSLSYNEITRLQKAFPDSATADASQAMRDARLVKTDFEIEKMRKDGLHQAAVYRNIPRLFKPDMTDLEFQIEIERELRREGCLGYLRTAGHLMEINMGSVIAGENADTPTPYDFALGGAGVDPSLPVGANGAIMHPGITVMVDMNGGFNGYQTDMTRTWCIGDVPELAEKAHKCSIEILETLAKEALPGVEVSQLYHRAEQIVKDRNLEDYFMGHKQKAQFIGHGVGIQLNEIPAITAKNHLKLMENMTIALEPKFVIPGVGAVGVENTYRVTPDGLECLTVFPEELQNLL